MESLAKLLETNKTASTLAFSKEIDKTHGEVRIAVPLEDTKLIYIGIKDEISDFTSSFEANFVTRGLDYIVKNIEPKNADNIFLTPHSAHMLKELAKKYDVFVPSWLPDVFRFEDPSGEHSFKCLYNWPTVSPAHIPHNLENYLTLKLSGSLDLSNAKLRSASTPTSNPGANISDIKAHNAKVVGVDKLKAKRSASVTAPSQPLSKDVAHGKFVAKKYLWLMDSAASRNLEFSISIEELSALLRENRCYYSKAELVSFPHEKGENSDHLPDNYLTIDRKNNDEGYVSGNVVVCSKEINQLKNQMTEKDFLQAIAFKTLVEQANLTPEQLNAFNMLMNTGG